MRLRRFGTFTGGIDLPDEKGATLAAAIEPAPAPALLRVPLDACGLGEARATVRPGQAVRAGERLGWAGDGELPVFAPRDGTVSDIGTCALAGGPDGRYLSPAVEMTDLGEATPWEAPDRFAAPTEPDELAARFAAAGLTSLTAPPVPLHRWARAARAAGADVLIVNAMENQPFLTGEHRLLLEQPQAAIGGLSLLAAAMQARTVYLAVDHRRAGAFRRLDRFGRGVPFQPVALEHKYPVGSDVVLTKILARREVPPGGSTLEVGVATVNIATCAAAWLALATGRACTERVLTLGGAALARPGNYRVSFGTPVADVLAAGEPAEQPVQWIHNGPMTGTSLPPEAVVGPATAALLALPPQRETPAGTCIRCAWCTSHCPVRLNVAALNDLYELGRLDEAQRYDVRACTSCGVCSYVCPARLPLTHRMKQLKCALRIRAGQPCAGLACGAPDCGREAIW